MLNWGGYNGGETTLCPGMIILHFFRAVSMINGGMSFKGRQVS